MTDRLLDIRQAARRLGISVGYLRKLRDRGVGPPAVQVGYFVRWRESVVDEWCRARESARPVGSSAPAPPAAEGREP